MVITLISATLTVMFECYGKMILRFWHDLFTHLHKCESVWISFAPSVQFWGLCSCCLLVVLSVALESVVQQAPVCTNQKLHYLSFANSAHIRKSSCADFISFFDISKKYLSVKAEIRAEHGHLLSKLRSYLLLFPWSTPAPALRLIGWLGSAWLRRRLFGPTVTHACVCPPASKSVGIKAWSSGLEGLKRRRAEYQELEMWSQQEKKWEKKWLLLNAVLQSSFTNLG